MIHTNKHDISPGGYLRRPLLEFCLAPGCKTCSIWSQKSSAESTKIWVARANLRRAQTPEMGLQPLQRARFYSDSPLQTIHFHVERAVSRGNRTPSCWRKSWLRLCQRSSQTRCSCAPGNYVHRSCNIATALADIDTCWYLSDCPKDISLSRGPISVMPQHSANTPGSVLVLITFKSA